ncbi:MAG TPA: hypothetical protein VNF50_00945 [Acidimicrobiales bacterium]|nr:hypothetical protein [Acidimicrobiales bacterium]
MTALGRSFDQAWAPRLGSDAAAQLRRLAICAAALGPVVIGLSVAAGLGVRSGSGLAVALAILCVLIVAGLCVGWVRLSIGFARTVSEWFGQELGWRELPRFRPSLFDHWCQQRGLQIPPGR